MNNKEFEDFFKDLDPNEAPVPSETEEEDEDLVFASFFEDATTKNKKEVPAPVKKVKPVFEEDVFAPPPPSEEEEEEEPAPVIFMEEPEEEYIEEPERKRPAKAPISEAQKKKRKRIYNTAYNWLLTVVWVSAVLAVSVFIATFALSSINDLVGFSKESKEIKITIPENSSIGEIAEILEEYGVIDEPFTFELYARIKEKSLASGTYTLNSNLGYDQIFQALRKKDGEKKVVSVTIIEGMTISEIAKVLEEEGVCKYDEFMAAVDTETFEYEFESMMGTDEMIFHKWEGYLFPDTYEFYTNSSPRSVMSRFVANFNNKISDYYVRMQEMGLSLHETITLASVIQSEAGVKTDMENVSSVFHNRMEEGSGLPNLQSDVTWFYVRDEIKPSDDMLEEYRAYYDTYVRKGLPVGPVCNPGIDAIEAALYPTETNYYYFVTDMKGTFYYASTFAQHEENVRKAGLGQ